MDPDMLLMVFYMCLMGAAIGSVSGLIPGIHVNTLSMILLAFSAPLLAAVSHSKTASCAALCQILL